MGRDGTGQDGLPFRCRTLPPLGHLRAPVGVLRPGLSVLRRLLAIALGDRSSKATIPRPICPCAASTARDRCLSTNHTLLGVAVPKTPEDGTVSLVSGIRTATCQGMTGCIEELLDGGDLSWRGIIVYRQPGTRTNLS